MSDANAERDRKVAQVHAAQERYFANWTAMESFIREHGRPYEARPWKSSGKWIVRGARSPNGCFRNALVLASQNPELIYVEGFAAPGVHHAWCIDSPGRVVDSTPHWADGHGDYFGVALDLRFVARIVLADPRGAGGVLLDPDGRDPSAIIEREALA